MIKYIVLVAVVNAIWIVYALRSAPEVDDNGNIIDKKKIIDQRFSRVKYYSYIYIIIKTNKL